MIALYLSSSLIILSNADNFELSSIAALFNWSGSITTGWLAIRAASSSSSTLIYYSYSSLSSSVISSTFKGSTGAVEALSSVFLTGAEFWLTYLIFLSLLVPEERGKDDAGAGTVCYKGVFG